MPKKLNLKNAKAGDIVVFRNGGKSKILANEESYVNKKARFIMLVDGWGLNFFNNGSLYVVSSNSKINDCPFDIVAIEKGGDNL
jgi:signal peptidase I